MEESSPTICSVARDVPASAAPAETIRSDFRLIGFLSAGHLVIDVTQGALPAFLPFLKSAHGLSYAAAAGIVLAANVSSSVIQPAFGFLADRVSRRWLLPVSVLIAALALGLTGVAPSYGVLLALVVFMGLGVAAYHPEGYRLATSVAGSRKATALSWFSLGGNIGIALGPPVITALVISYGMKGSLGVILPGCAVAAVLLLALPRSRPEAVHATRLHPAARSAHMPWAMTLLILIVTIRSWAHLGFTTFVPFYYVDHLKADPRLVGPLLFVFLGAGALGTVLAGPIADRWGARRFMVWAFLLSAPLAVLFLKASGAAAFFLLGLFGGVLISTFSIAVVLGQSYMPGYAGMASGLIVGFAIGMGGMGVTLLGWIADRHGLLTALWITALMPLAGFLACILLPPPRDKG